MTQKIKQTPSFGAPIVVITTNPGALPKIWQDCSANLPALPLGVFLVDAQHFQCGLESLSDNRYMERSPRVDRERAIRQAMQLGQRIAACGVPVVTFPSRADQPDGIFPNNVFAPVGDRLLVGAMRHEERRREAQRQDIRDFFTNVAGRRVLDIADSGGIAELTGPLIIDRARGVGFCGMSDRVDERGLAAMHEGFGLRATLSFALRPGEYHTNVVMSILAGRALIVNPDAIADVAVAEALINAYHPAVIELDDSQTESFAGNCLAVNDRDVFISERGAQALRGSQRASLEKLGFHLHAVDVEEIEKSGGSVRCMIGEIF